MLRVLVVSLSIDYKPFLELIYVRASLAKNNPLQTEIKVVDVLSQLRDSAAVNWF
jgi:hypothetical protein